MRMNDTRGCFEEECAISFIDLGDLPPEISFIGPGFVLVEDIKRVARFPYRIG